jgi:hypothetical protein
MSGPNCSPTPRLLTCRPCSGAGSLQRHSHIRPSSGGSLFKDTAEAEAAAACVSCGVGVKFLRWVAPEALAHQAFIRRLPVEYNSGSGIRQGCWE